jgi:carbon starvation protein
MNLLFLLVGGGVIFLLGSRFYAAIVVKSYGIDPARPTPAVEKNDGRDFVPTKTHVLFAHHFSAIAGAGPIIGPTIALLYGYIPAWCWIVFGCVFIGAVHDFTAIFVSIREGGRSMAEVSRTTLGKASFLMFILFTIIMLVLVSANFLVATSVSLTSMWPLAKLGLAEGQTLLQTAAGANGEQLGIIGGIASTSVVIITLFSPLLGYLIYKRGISLRLAYPLAAVICLGSVVAGVYFPISFEPRVWMIILSIYVFFAAALPVWLILQPRDFINVQILYLGLILLAVGVLIAGSQGATMQAPSVNIGEGMEKFGALWPMLFITIACGAISGLHALVAGGTTAKQISTEGHVKRIGYDGMLLEGVLALLVLLAVGSALSFDDYRLLVWPSDTTSANPILAFSLAVGHLLNNTLALPQVLATVFGILLVEGFVITTLDVVVRLNRYLFEELWNIIFAEKTPAFMKNAQFNAGLAVLLMISLAFVSSFISLWPLFGASNQLLAGLTLVVVSAWMIEHGKRAIYTTVPAAFVLVTALASLLTLLGKYYREGNYLLAGADLVLLAMSFAVLTLLVKKLPRLLTGANKKLQA